MVISGFNFEDYFSFPFWLSYLVHRRTGLEIWGGGKESARLALKARKSLEGSGGMLPRKILKNRVSLMPFPVFWSGFLCMEQEMNEKKILRILMNKT